MNIIIVACDKDVHCLQTCSHSISKHVKVEHNIIVVDNTSDSSCPKSDNYTLVQPGYNTYILEGRRLGLDLAQDEWTWFIDIDDEIIGDILPEDFIGKEDAEFIQFFYKTDIGPWAKPGVVKNNPKCLGRGGWSRFYKTEILKNILSPIKRNIDVVNYDDAFILDLYLDTPKKIVFLNKILYQYNLSSSTQHQLTQEKVDFSCIGEENFEYLSSFFQKPEIWLDSAKRANQYLRDTLKSQN